MEFSGNGHYVQCPLCEGKGQMHRSDLVAKLSDAGLASRFATCLEMLRKEVAGSGGKEPVKARAATAGCEGANEFEREVLTHWASKRFLWRRSPKE